MRWNNPIGPWGQNRQMHHEVGSLALLKLHLPTPHDAEDFLVGGIAKGKTGGVLHFLFWIIAQRDAIAAPFRDCILVPPRCRLVGGLS